jgi:ERCC4-type nuclease
MEHPRSFTVKVDTREKQPWQLVSARVIGRDICKLDTGDYTVEGLEDKICIDRKAAVSELAQNITTKRFINELERIKEFPHAFLMCEFTVADVLNFPETADLPPAVKRRIRVNGNYLMKCLNRLQIKYGFNIIYAGNRENAERIAVNLMEEVLKLYDDNDEQI